MDNKSGQVIPGRKGLMKDLSLFSEEQDKPKVSPQMQLAILQYLATGKILALFFIMKRIFMLVTLPYV